MEFKDWVTNQQFRKTSVAILGNGPSLTDTPPSLLQERHGFILGINRTGPDPDYDLDWFMSLEREWLPPADTRWARHHVIWHALQWKHPTALDIILRPGDVQVGQTSALPAVHFCALGGAQEIHIYGVDCQHIDGKHRYTGENTKSESSLANKGRVWKALLAGAVKGYPHIRFVNHSPVSEIAGWERA